MADIDTSPSGFPLPPTPQLASSSVSSTNSNSPGPIFSWKKSDLERLHQWITCICLVDFDLNIGQTLKFAYPEGSLTDSEKTNIANLSLPDSHSNDEVGDCYFCFRFRTDQKANTLHGRRHPFLFGFACFRQKEDATIHRGYFQKSVVIITHLPHAKLFKECTATIGKSYFAYGTSILEAACRNMATWPSPSSTEQLHLPLLGEILTLMPSSLTRSPSQRFIPDIPDDGRFDMTKLKKQLAQPTNVPSPRSIPKQFKRNFTQICAMGYPADIVLEALEITDNILEDAITIVAQKFLHKNSSKGKQLDLDWDPLKRDLSNGYFQEVNVFSVFRNHIKNLWYLWELAITGQPLLVTAKQANECSDAVLCLISLISPVRFEGDYRPYFTVYDPDFKAFCSLHDHGSIPPIMLGITNPYFCKAMNNFPNILFLSQHHEASSPPSNIAAITVKSAAAKSKKQTYEKRKRRNMDTSLNTIVTNQNHLITRHSMHFTPDQSILNRLLTVQNTIDSTGAVSDAQVEIAEVSAINNRILRKYFRELTHNFLKPFERYFTYSDSFLKQKRFNPYISPPKIPSFSETEFLEWVLNKSPKEFWSQFPLKNSVGTSKRKMASKIYAKFLKSPHFPSWFAEKRSKVEDRRRKQIYQKIRRLRFNELVGGMSVTDGMKMWREIKRHVHRVEGSPDANGSTKSLLDVLQSHLQILARALPRDILERLQVNRNAKASAESNKQIMSVEQKFQLNVIENYMNSR